MAETTPLPDSEVLYCINGHRLKSYTEWRNPELGLAHIGRGTRVYGFCDECGEPYIFDWYGDAWERVPLPRFDDDKPVDLPPFKFPDDSDFNKG